MNHQDSSLATYHNLSPSLYNTMLEVRIMNATRIHHQMIVMVPWMAFGSIPTIGWLNQRPVNHSHYHWRRHPTINLNNHYQASCTVSTTPAPTMNQPPITGALPSLVSSTITKSSITNPREPYAIHKSSPSVHQHYHSWTIIDHHWPCVLNHHEPAHNHHLIMNHCWIIINHY